MMNRTNCRNAFEPFPEWTPTPATAAAIVLGFLVLAELFRAMVDAL
jgi:hypothetical protein